MFEVLAVVLGRSMMRRSPLPRSLFRLDVSNLKMVLLHLMNYWTRFGLTFPLGT